MKLTKSKLKQLILEVLKEAKKELSIIERLNRYAKANGKTIIEDSPEQFKKMYKTNPKYKAAVTKAYIDTLAWEKKKGLNKFASDEKPQTSTTKGPGVDAKSTTTQSGKTKTTTTAGTVSTANNKVKTDWRNLLGALAGDMAKPLGKIRNNHVRFVKDTVANLFARGWNPATGMPGLLKMDKNAYKNLVKNTGWTPERMKAKLKRMAGSP